MVLYQFDGFDQTEPSNLLHISSTFSLKTYPSQDIVNWTKLQSGHIGHHLSTMFTGYGELTYKPRIPEPNWLA